MGDDFPPVEGVRHHYVDLPGFRAHVAEAGDPEAPPVLLLHGWPQHWYMWRRLIEALQGDHRLVAPDLRGFGWSEAPGEGYDPETFASDQAPLLDALGIERATVIGHDWGGFATFLFALRWPQRAERILVFNAPHPWPAVNLRVLAEQWRIWYVLVNVSPLGELAARRGFAARILRGGNVHPAFEDEELELYLERLREPERARATTRLYRSYLGRLASVLRKSPYARLRLTVPAWLVFGERDRYVSRHLLGGHERNAPDLEIELVPDSGHFIVNEKPELCVARARQLLASA